jgi:hypothetical protein
VSRPRTMALQEETANIVNEFNFSDEDVNKSVREFLRQMGESFPFKLLTGPRR